MTLSPRRLTLKSLVVKDQTTLALDTGFAPDSLEGIRLVKASRGQGWFYDGTLRPWTTRGVLQEDRRLVIWGEVDALPPGESPESWPQQGPEGREFLRAFVEAWAARAALSDRLAGFTPSSVLPWRTAQGWAFGFPPDDLRGVLDSVQPLSDRLAWQHYQHPDAGGATSWAFTSAALGVFLGAQSLPWAQGDEEHLRQELRVLKRTLTADELPEALDGATRQLWFDALTVREPRAPGPRWQAWVRENRPWDGGTDPAGTLRRDQARKKRERRRGQAAFWRRRGAVVSAVGAGVLLVVALVGTVVWGVVKPDPTDTWTPKQVVDGYYSGMSSLDSELMRKVTSFDAGREVTLARDQEEVTNRYVIRQVRTAYERDSPVVDAAAWEAAGKPPVAGTKVLYGLVDVDVYPGDPDWTVTYRKWSSEPSDQGVHIVGNAVTDHLLLEKTGRGWKITSLHRETQPLP